MTTTLEQVHSLADSGESLEDRRAFLETKLAQTVFSHYDDAACGDDQFAHTD